MKNLPISIIAAIGDKNRVLGKDNKLLWHIKADLARFKKLTKGHAVIMGRKTMDSVLGYLGTPLPGRVNIVITRNEEYSHHGVIRASSLDDAIAKAKSIEDINEEKEIFIAGGAQIYEEAIKVADRLYLTLVKTDIEGDAYFPPYPEFTKRVAEDIGADGEHEYTFLTLEK